MHFNWSLDWQGMAPSWASIRMDVGLDPIAYIN